MKKLSTFYLSCPWASILLLMFLLSCATKDDRYTTWHTAGASKEGTRYSSLTQIDTTNVSQLRVAWTYHTGDADTVNHSQIQCNPIVVDGVMYGTSPMLKLIAVDASTGKEKWVFDPRPPQTMSAVSNFILNNNRGVTYWTDGQQKRILYSAGGFLLSVDATTGKLDSNFGEGGKIDLHNDLGRDVHDLYVASTSPGVIYKNTIIIGTRVSEGSDAAPGHIRAYDVLTGKLRWIFHTIPQPGEFGFDTWEDSTAWKNIGGANSWPGFTLDEKRGIVYAPTGSASFDFYGGMRRGDNLFSDCILALDAATGKHLWHFQDIHHDVWDRDFPTAPSLVTVTHNGKKIDALAQPTKTGFIFLLNREDGTPLFPIEEKSFPTNTELIGEKLSPTQPIPSLPEPFMRQSFTENDLNNLLPDSSYQELKQRFHQYKSGNMFEPPSRQGTIFFPGLDGGAEWGGPAVDPESAILYVNANEVPWVITIADVKQQSTATQTYPEAGRALYMKNCLACHGPELKGGGNYPSLIGVERKYNQDQFVDLISTGRRMMPAFTRLSAEEKDALAAYVLNLTAYNKKKFTALTGEEDKFKNLPYTITGYNKFQSKEGYPAIAPPWGTLNAVSLNTGKVVWRIPLGFTPEFKKKGIITGTENYGGPAVTAGGLVFIAATTDKRFRAFNKRSGELLWETELPAAAFATPAVYNVGGKQYVVIACGGGKLGTKSGDSYVAFSLGE